jgi:1-phosphofructokinase
MNPPAFEVLTVTLNPAIDRTVTITNFTAGIVNRVEDVRQNPGGKGVNVAAALADHGLRVAVTGFLGRENTASFEALFARKKIEDRFVRIDGSTRVGIKIVDPALHQTTDINFPGPAPSAVDLAALHETLSAIDASCVVLAGSLPPGVDAAIYGKFVTALKARGKRVVLDASGEPLRHALEAKPHLIKPNIHELAELIGKPLDGEAAVIAAARELISRGIEQVVVSMGRDGACFVTADAVVTARPPEVTVKSTVGAGDNMVAGIIAARFRELSLADTAKLATAFSLEALTRNGQPRQVAAAVSEFMPQVTITTE